MLAPLAACRLPAPIGSPYAPAPLATTPAEPIADSGNAKSDENLRLLPPDREAQLARLLEPAWNYESPLAELPEEEPEPPEIQQVSWEESRDEALAAPPLGGAQATAESAGTVEAARPLRFWGYTQQFGRDVVHDYAHFYSPRNLAWFAIGIGVAAPLANTSADQDFRDWYQQNLTSDQSNNVARYAKHFGEQWQVVPVYLGAAAIGGLLDDLPVTRTTGEWGARSARAMLVGVPPLLLGQAALGAGRPEEQHPGWKPFNDTNGISGHSFVGAVPFLTAAQMTDRPALKAAFFAASTAAGWSRINDDDHYISQVMLGWWLAYLSTRSVDQTNRDRSTVQLVPLPTSPGVGLLYEY